MRLKDKVAIVTGSKQGIGAGIAGVFSREGASVVVADIEEDGGIKKAEELGAQEGKAIFVKTDVSDSRSVQNMSFVSGNTSAMMRLVFPSYFLIRLIISVL